MKLLPVLPIKVLLVEDHTIVRNGIKSLLNSEPNIEVVGEAINGLEALKLLENKIEVDVILLDINMPEMGGMELLKNLTQTFPAYKVIILSMLDHENYVWEGINSGAMGYLLKSVSNDELMFAINHIAIGGKYICSELAFKMMARAPQLSEFMDAGINVDLSKREMEVLKLIAEGYTNHEIADKLFTSRRTVEGHRQNLIEKTGVKNSAALIMHAVRVGIIK